MPAIGSLRLIQYPRGSTTVYTLVMDQGSYTLTGQAATPKAARLLTADQGSYSLTGQVDRKSVV